MGEKIGIKFIEPDSEMEDDMKFSSKVRKRLLENSHFYSQSRVRKRVQPDFIHVLPLAPIHKRQVSTAPNRVIQHGGLTLQVLELPFIGLTADFFICPIPTWRDTECQRTD